MVENVRLSTKQKKAIAALMSEPTTEAAARKAGITSKTIRKWLAEQPDFRQALERAETEAISAAARSLSGGAIEATELLRTVVSDTDAKISERRKAAAQILANLPRLRVLSDIEETIKRIEALAGGLE